MLQSEEPERTIPESVGSTRGPRENTIYEYTFQIIQTLPALSVFMTPSSLQISTKPFDYLNWLNIRQGVKLRVVLGFGPIYNGDCGR